jgi:carboxylesterase type B
MLQRLPMLTSVYLFVAVLAEPALSIFTSENDPTIPTAHVLNGTYTGIHSEEYNQDFFLGIPYAQPSVGDLRFRQAQPLNFSWSDPRNATSYSLECIGYGSDQWVLGNHISEDCLTLNVIRPANTNTSKNSSSLPVAVWIHGGSFNQGGNADPRYNLSFIIQESVNAGMPFIGVSINYRLSTWGFLFGKEIMDAGSANIGLRDQRLAFLWVQENIAAFGGDPRRVTIWGESAGAMSVGMHLIAYGGRDDGLFHSAISESGTPPGIASSATTPASWQPFYDRIAKAANCSTAADSLDCLRKVPVDILSAIFNSSVTRGAPLSPMVDGDLIPASSSKLLLSGQFVKVPYLVGANHDEGSAFAPRGINSTSQLLYILDLAGLDNITATALTTLYPDNPDQGIPPTFLGRPPASQMWGAQFKRVAALVGDLGMHAPRRLTNQMWAKYGAKSYAYDFDMIPNGHSQEDGASHFLEVPFVFCSFDGLGYEDGRKPFTGKPAYYEELARKMARAWSAFIVKGEPNTGK